MMTANRKEKEPEAAETPRTARIKTTPGEGIIHVGKAPGHKEVNLSPQGRLESNRVIGTAVLRIPQDQRKNERRRHEKQEKKKKTPKKNN